MSAESSETHLSHSYRLSFLGLIAWLSVCLVIAGWYPNVSPDLGRFWILAGVFGIAASVGLLSSAKAEVRRHHELLESYISEARTDALTGLANRRAFEKELAQRSASWRRGATLSLLLLDVDHFKAFNDTHGHQAGDEMLRQMAGLLCDCLNGQGLAARYGGEEFVVVLHNTHLDEAMQVAERIRRAAEDDRFPFRGNLLHVTISIGVVQTAPSDSAERLVQRADTALFAAKNAGRNRVMSEKDLITDEAAESTETQPATACQLC